MTIENGPWGPPLPRGPFFMGQAGSAQMSFRFTIPITKIDAERREVWGYATVEEIDRQGEIIDFEASKRAFAALAADFSKRTDGKSLGNLREMHLPKVA